VKHCTCAGSTHFPELLAIEAKSFHAISQSLNPGSRVVLWNVWHPPPNTCVFTVYMISNKASLLAVAVILFW